MTRCEKCDRYRFSAECNCKPFTLSSYYWNSQKEPTNLCEVRTQHGVDLEDAIEKYCQRDHENNGAEATEWLIQAEGKWFHIETEYEPSFAINEVKKESK